MLPSQNTQTDRQSAIKLRPINKETLKKIMSGNGSFRNSAVSV